MMFSLCLEREGQSYCSIPLQKSLAQNLTWQIEFVPYNSVSANGILSFGHEEFVQSI